MQEAPALMTFAGSLAVATVAVDPASLLTVACTVLIAMLSGMATYRFAIRTARREIKEAFEEHIEQMHVQHQQFVAAVIDRDAPPKE
jgi:hypothetical protein